MSLGLCIKSITQWLIIVFLLAEIYAIICVASTRALRLFLHSNLIQVDHAMFPLARTMPSPRMASCMRSLKRRTTARPLHHTTTPASRQLPSHLRSMLDANRIISLRHR